ncbi:MAG: hypothetical protein B6U87_03275 [Candidatus Aenigmarchaeota archaeon ex4484_52]|nr:MAG: hypothetical protein B6U87_03275 [Candidatus Aenigmarchaeota archaeon ex4484_52]
MPAYFANSSAVFFKGDKPLDFGKKLKDGKRILGDGKTFEGTLGGLFLGTFVGFLQYLLYKKYFTILANNEFIQYSIFFGFVISLGAMLGDIVESFIKRRLNIKRGGEIIWDKLDFLFGSIILGYLFCASQMLFLNIYHFIFLLIITPFVHKLFNVIAFDLKLKDVSW